MMREYQVAVARIAGKAREDEETLTDLLNERSRAGWEYHDMTPLGADRVAVVFTRETP